MTRKNEPLEIEQKIVVTIDICSSTSIIGDLHNTENLKIWRDFLIWIKSFLQINSEKENYYIYKFTGDGWIILFENNCRGDRIINFLQKFCNQYSMRYRRLVENTLDRPPNISGITFGIDRGSLIKLEMNEQIEYIGRAINVACRLQSSIKDKDKFPQYKALMTKHLYNDLKNSLSNVRIKQVRRKLRNITEEEANYIKIIFSI